MLLSVSDTKSQATTEVYLRDRELKKVAPVR